MLPIQTGTTDFTKVSREKKNNPLTTRASTATARSSYPPTCKQRPKDEGGKNWLTNDGHGAAILVVKLKRTDTTLDLSL
jgi:hypothetical protein